MKGWAHLPVKGPAWLQQIPGVQLLVIQSPACHSLTGSLSLNSPLYPVTCSPAMLGWIPQSLQHDCIPLRSLLGKLLCTPAHTHEHWVPSSLEPHLISTFLKIYFYSIRIVCIFSSSLHPTRASPTSLRHLYPLP